MTLTGPVRWIGDAARHWATPANDPAANRWYWYDRAALADAFGAEPLPVVLVESRGVLPPGPAVPVPQPMAVNLPNNHLGYAITWYGLAVALVVIYALYGRKRAKETRGRRCAGAWASRWPPPTGSSCSAPGCAPPTAVSLVRTGPPATALRCGIDNVVDIPVRVSGTFEQ